MKKITLMLIAGFSLSSVAQTIVPTTPQNKKIILEEFTGIHCVYCPSGHTIANSILSANPGNAFVINVHVGGYATPSAGEPDFRTSFGTSIAGQTGLTGYPSGTVNRTVFSGLGMATGATAMGRGNWTTAANQTKVLSSYVNVAATATIDVNTRVLTVHVETYYTAGSPIATNKLNVALLQNNTTGPQTGGNAGNEYNHQHRLVHLLTGQWGDDITTTTTGSFVDRTYTYTIPAAYNSIPAVMGDFEIVAFVAEGNQKIISGNGATPTYTGRLSNDVKVFSVNSISDQCTAISPKLAVQNFGLSTITSLPISYNVNGGTNQLYTWTGSLASLGRTTITLPAISYPVLTNNTLNISLATDDNTANNTGTVNFNKSPEGTNSLTLAIQPDDYGSEITWNIKDSAGTTITSGGPYTDGDTTLISLPITLPADNCYTFNIIDGYGDGLTDPTNGYATLTDSNSLVIFNTNGNYGTGTSQNFATGAFLGTNDNFEMNSISLYPNPTTGIVKISSKTDVDVTITDVTGKVVYTAKQINDENAINLSALQSGIYLARIIDGSKEKVQKLILN